jgi:hypothetical protein
MEIGVAEAAEWLQVSPQRVRAMIASGALPARRVSRIWLIDTSQPWAVQRLSRPLSPRMAHGLIDLLSGKPINDLPAPQASRLRGYARRLCEHDQPGRLLAAWLAQRPDGVRIARAAHSADLPSLRADPRLVLSGASDPRSDISAVEVEAWVRADEWAAVEADHLLSPVGVKNVYVRLSRERVPHPVPMGLLMADLADWPGPREQQAVHRLIKQHYGGLACRGTS